MAKPVVIVGGGLAGLACAIRLNAAGVPFLLLEATERVGGRLKTDEFEGMRLDRGFQVYFEAYPNASQLLDQDGLDLRRFRPGALLAYDGRLELIDRDRPLSTLRSPALNLRDKVNTLRLTRQAVGTSLEALWGLPDATAERHLREMGFSENYLQRFARPFFGGVFLDRSLGDSRRMFLFVFRMLALGPASIPSLGIEQIPLQLARSLPGHRIRTHAPVSALERSGDRVTGVRLSTHERIDAEAVVLATDRPTTARLTDFEPVQPGKETVCLYFTTPEPVTDDDYLVLDSVGSGAVNHVAPLTNVAPELAPGRHLLCANVVGHTAATDDQLVAGARVQLSGWFPEGRVAEWRFVRSYRIRNAQMPQPPGLRENRLKTEPGVPGLFLAGEGTTNSSIDGAIESGIATADRLVWRLGR